MWMGWMSHEPRVELTLSAGFWLADLFPKLAGRVRDDASHPAQKGTGLFLAWLKFYTKSLT